MSRIVAFPNPRIPVRAAVLDLVSQQQQEAAIGADEAEFLSALRRIVDQAPALDLWDKYHGSESDDTSRIFARFAD